MQGLVLLPKVPTTINIINIWDKYINKNWLKMESKLGSSEFPVTKNHKLLDPSNPEILWDLWSFKFKKMEVPEKDNVISTVIISSITSHWKNE